MVSKKLIFVMVLFAGHVRADEKVRAVQEELRRRNIYFGDIDGQRTPELEKATKRYQKGKGFTPSGTEDPDTLRSLGLLARSPDEETPKELEWPEEPVLKSDAKIDVVVEAEQIGAEAGVAPASIAPEIIALEKSPTPAKVGVHPFQKVSRQGNAHASATDQRIDPAEVRKFVTDYLKAVTHNDLRSELKFYGDRVDYYANGEIDRRIIERSLKRYYLRWPSRKYAAPQIMKVAMVPSRGEINVTFRLNFSLKNHGRTVHGQTDNFLTIDAATSDPRIVSIGEHRVRL